MPRSRMRGHWAGNKGDGQNNKQSVHARQGWKALGRFDFLSGRNSRLPHHDNPSLKPPIPSRSHPNSHRIATESRRRDGSETAECDCQVRHQPAAAPAAQAPRPQTE
jgi:hypothetical protein